MQPLTQTDFTGGMTAAADSAKTPANAYRILLNGRVRRNAITGAFAPVRIETPNVVHQAVFASDDQLILVAGGEIYKLEDADKISKIPNSLLLSQTADVVYHVDTPAATNQLVGLDDAAVYASESTTTPECTILQDGLSQPALFFSQGVARRAQTYAEWTPALREYVPIGKQMCHSGKVTYIVSQDGRKIYRSVSGRPTDFVININNAGAKRGDAETTYTAVSAAKTKALVAGQNGGFLAFTGAYAYAGTPDSSLRLIFGELQIRPQELFPIGAIGQNSFTMARGMSVFVSPQGIQSFDQVLQLQQESNNTPFGAQIVDYIIRPITYAATATADDYTFFGLETIFGDGVLVYDNQLETFVSIDLVGRVKEFAVVQQAGRSRVFFITTANELFELPLYSGARKAYSVYFGERTAGSPRSLMSISKVVLGFNNIRAAGAVTVEAYADRARDVSGMKQLTLPRELSAAMPVVFPTEASAGAAQITFDFKSKLAYTAGLAVTVAADADLIEASIELDTPTVVNVKHETLEEEIFYAVGDVGSDANFYSNCTAAIDSGGFYTAVASAAETFQVGGETYRLAAPYFSRAFIAEADRAYLGETGQLFSWRSLGKLLKKLRPADRLILLGDLGYEASYGAITAALNFYGRAAHDVLAVAGDNDRLQRAAFTSAFGRPRRSKVSTTYVNFYLFNDPADEGNENWLAANVDDSKFNVVLFHESPYNASAAGESTSLRWNFRKYGVHAVLSANSGSYQRTYVNAVYYFAAGTGNPRVQVTNPNGITTQGYLLLRAGAARLIVEFYDLDDNIRDAAFITR